MSSVYSRPVVELGFVEHRQFGSRVQTGVTVNNFCLSHSPSVFFHTGALLLSIHLLKNGEKKSLPQNISLDPQS